MGWGGVGWGCNVITIFGNNSLLSSELLVARISVHAIGAVMGRKTEK